MLKITKFVDTVKEAVEEICEELRTRKNLSKAEIKREIVITAIVLRYHSFLRKVLKFQRCLEMHIFAIFYQLHVMYTEHCLGSVR